MIVLSEHLFDGVNESLGILGRDNDVPLPVMAAYDDGTVLVQASGKFDTWPETGIVLRFGVVATVGSGNVVDVKGQEAGLNGDRTTRPDIDLSRKDGHVYHSDENETPA